MNSRLERLLRIRKTEECVDAGRWAKARLEAEARQADVRSVESIQASADADLRARISGRIDPVRLRLASEARDALTRERSRTESRAHRAELEATERHREFEATARAAKALEKVAERRAAEDRARERAAEIRESDDRLHGVSR
jgi:hypothetical protein